MQIRFESKDTIAPQISAKIGSNNFGVKLIIGVHGRGLRNDNGGRLIDLCQAFQHIISSSIFPHKEIDKYTWTSRNRKTENQIDHICVSRK